MRLFTTILVLLLAIPAGAQSADERLAEASALFDAKRYNQAAEKLDQFLALFPTHERTPNVALALGRCCTELKDFKRALPAYEKAAVSRDAAIRGPALLGLGEAAIQTSEWARAVRALDEVGRSSLKPEQEVVVWYWLGEARFELKQYSTSEEAYARVVMRFSDHPLAASAAYSAALAALEQEKPQNARRHAQWVLDRAPRSEDRPRARLLLAQLDLEAKQFREARSGFEAVLDDTSEAARQPAVRDAALEGVVQTLLELGDLPGAADRLQKLIGGLPAGDPRRARALLSLGACRFRQKQYDGALAAYREAADAREPVVAGEASYWLANTLSAQEQHAQAAAEFERFLKRYPEHELAARALLRMGDAYAAARQPVQAAAAYRAVVTRFSNAPQADDARKALANLTNQIADPVALTELLRSLGPEQRAVGAARLARLYLEKRAFADAEKALTDFLKGIAAADIPAEARYLTGVALEGQDRAAPAVAALVDAVSREPRATWAADAQTRLAWLYLDLKRPQDAERAARACLDSQPAATIRQQATQALIQSLLAQERWEPSLTEARAALERNPDPENRPALLYTVAWVLEKLGKIDEALPSWEQLLQQHRRSEYAVEALIRIGDARFRAKKHAEAREQYAQAVMEAPKGDFAQEARFKLGTTLYHLDRHEEAAAEWDRVTSARPPDQWVPESLYWSGVSLVRCNRKKDAIMRLERLVAEFPKHARVGDARVRLAGLKAVTN